MLLEKVVQGESLLPADLVHQLGIIADFVGQVGSLLAFCLEALVEPAADDVQEQLIGQCLVVNHWHFLV